MIISRLADVERGAQYLAEVEPRFADALKLTGPLPLRRREEGFVPLLDMIVSQQLSVASSDAIWKRLEEAGLTDRESLRGCDAEKLRRCGLSKQKVRYARALAEECIEYSALNTLSDGDLVTRLKKILGIGRWTAEIYGMFSLGRPDMFAAGDLALQESCKILFGLSARPNENELRARAEPWSPWRAVAARLLWSYYRVVKTREGVR